jgi:hypothetical protein
LIDTNRFSDFELLITTGNFDAAIVHYPESLSPNEWERLFELIPNMAAAVKGFALSSYKQSNSFPEETGQYGRVVRVFKPLESVADEMLHYIVEALKAPDNRPNTKFVPPWEQTSRAFSISFEAWPSEVATACEQYLIVFRDFLSEIGIKATTSIAHEAGQVLFSVVPDDPDEVLEAIREALTIYLQLPAITAGTVVAASDDINVMKLQAQVEHFMSQLTFAKATIQQQQITIDLLQRVGPTKESLLPASTSDMIPTGNREATILWGLLRIGDVEIRKGLTCPLGEIINKGRSRVENYRGQRRGRQNLLEGPK